MRKVVIRRPGGHERLELEELPDPEPGPGEVLVRTRAAGVNFADTAVRMGLYASAKKYVGWPITPGFEFAGEVAALGAGLDGPPVGASVFGVSRFGGWSTHVCVPRHQVFDLPRGWSAEQAAGFPAVHLTAWYAVEELARPRPGEAALVHSAAGGVGCALAQLLAVRGARVVGVVRGAHKVAVARDHGCDVVVDKGPSDPWPAIRAAAPEGYGCVFDANGVETLGKSWAVLGAPGRLVVYGFATMLRRGKDRPSWPKLAWDWLRTPRFQPLEMTEHNKSVLAFNLSFLFPRADVLGEAMEDLLGRVEAGTLRPPSVTTFDLDACADAQAAIESGTTTGKLVLLT